MTNSLLKTANREAIFNVYLYLSHYITPEKHESFPSIVTRTENALTSPSARITFRMNILKNAVKNSSELKSSELIAFTRSENGLTACAFIRPDNSVSVAFKGTGSGEWIDNGEGLSGIPQENTYLTYKRNVVFSQTVHNDFATEQQVEALNWFNYVLHKNRLQNACEITVSGHSKGGNKAQFIAMHQGIVNTCVSFDGQGFSPEAVLNFKKLYSATFDKRQRRIYGFSSANDYVNVLGERIIPETNLYYFESKWGLHQMEAILNEQGNFRPQAQQGMLSSYAQNLSAEIMKMRPEIRQHATLGIMNIFQKYIGKGTPVNGDFVSNEKTIAGIAVAAASFLKSLY